eukprot:4161642-Pyramimonas_sp.AAC.1
MSVPVARAAWLAHVGKPRITCACSRTDASGLCGPARVACSAMCILPVLPTMEMRRRDIIRGHPWALPNICIHGR